MQRCHEIQKRQDTALGPPPTLGRHPGLDPQSWRGTWERPGPGRDPLQKSRAAPPPLLPSLSSLLWGLESQALFLGMFMLPPLLPPPSRRLWNEPGWSPALSFSSALGTGLACSLFPDGAGLALGGNESCVLLGSPRLPGFSRVRACLQLWLGTTLLEAGFPSAIPDGPRERRGLWLPATIMTRVNWTRGRAGQRPGAQPWDSATKGQIWTPTLTSHNT